MGAPLSKNQKRELAQLATRAYCETHAGVSPTAREVAEWRHEQVLEACGKLGLRGCSQDDYHTVKAHFLDLAGEPGQALQVDIRGQTNPERIARWKLEEACRVYGFEISYPAAIARRQFHGAALDDLNRKQLWSLVFTIINRGRAKRRAVLAAPKGELVMEAVASI